MENEPAKKSQDLLVEARHYKQLAVKERAKGRIRHAQEMEQHVQRLNQEAAKLGGYNAKLANETTVPEVV